MKDYKEMTKCVLEARDAHEAKKGKKLSKASGANTASTGEVYSVKKTDKKKVMLGIAPVFGGVLVAVLIGIIVSDHSVDRPEEKTTEIITEATEMEPTEEPYLITEATILKTTEEVIQEAAVTTTEQQDTSAPVETKDPKYGDQENEDIGAEKKTGIVGRRESTYSGDDHVVEKKQVSDADSTPAETKDDQNMEEVSKEPELPETDDQTYGGKLFQWKKTIQVEGDITYELASQSTHNNGQDTNMYVKYYKGMKTADCAFFNRDGSRCPNIGTDDITLEMLESVDFSNAEKNLAEIEAKMAEFGCERVWFTPGLRMEPTIQIRKTAEGDTTLAYVISYENTNPCTEEEYGLSDDRNWGVLEFDLITGELIR